jgi:hypothetical protein
MDNELAAVLSALALLAGSVYAGVKKAYFQCLAAAGAFLYVLAKAVSDF